MPQRIMIAWCWACAWMASAASPAVDPAEELKQFRLPPGFDIQLFASDPSMAKPIQMNFDAKGRLWLVTSESYPQLVPGAEPQDSVIILEDTDQDGRADRSTIFADKLRIPTGIEPIGDGAYVGNSIDLIHLEDTDADGKADRRSVTLSAFGTEDTHHLIHTFRFAPWGNLFFAQAVYIHSHVETPWGVRRLEGGGFWEFDARQHKLDVFVTGMTNSWGIAFDAFGQAFGVDNDQFSVNYFPPGAHLIRTPNESHVFPSLVSQKPKYCGAEFVASPLFPDDWQGQLLTCDFRAHRLCRYKITDQGAGYTAEELPELLATPNVAFRPVDLKFGPDGALYVCDWYNPIINHGEVDFRDPRRDRTHGRIWRITPTGKAPLPVVDLTAEPTEALVERLASTNGVEESLTRKALASRPTDDVLPALVAWEKRQSDEMRQLRALWAYELIDADPAKSTSFLTLQNASSPRVRAAVLRVISRRAGLRQFELTMADLERWAKDSHPAVHAEVVRLAGQLGTSEALALALSLAPADCDPVVDYAVKLVLREQAATWISALREGNDFGIPTSSWTRALLAVDQPLAVPTLLTWVTEGRIEPDKAVLSMIGRHGSADQLAELVTRANMPNVSSSEQSAIIASLAEAHQQRQVVPSGPRAEVLTGWLNSQNQAVVRQAIPLAGRWQIEETRPTLVGIIEDAKDPYWRKQAIDSLAQLGGASASYFLDKFEKTENVGDRMTFLAALASLDPQLAADRASEWLTQASPDQAAPLVGVFLKLREGPDLLAASLRTRSLSPETATEAVKRMNAAGQAFPALLAALRKAGNLPAEERSFTPKQLEEIARRATQEGDPHRGRDIYNRKELACSTCHRIGPTGGSVGPDLTSIGASAPVDYLVESMLLPSAKVKENYHSIIIFTDEGKVITGIPEQQSETEIIVRLADNSTVAVPKASIDDSKQGQSLMPTDVVDALPTGELLDLVRYLSELGKPGPFGSAVEQVARKWRLRGPVRGEEGDPLEKAVLGGTDNPSDWRESLTTNDAWVYVRELALNPELTVMFAETTISVEGAGKVQLLLQPGPKAAYWIDGEPISTEPAGGENSTALVALEPGDHKLTMRIDLASVPHFVKLRAYAVDSGVKVSLEQPE